MVVEKGKDDVATTAGYRYTDSGPSHTGAYLWSAVLRELQEVKWGGESKRVFELGCGNGAFAALLASRGYDITAVDPSSEGVKIANASYPGLRIEAGSAYDNLAGKYGQYRAVVALEVVEHVYFPRKFADCVFDLLQPGGVAIVSTPYHSYLKNLVLASTGKMDAHFTALWDHGHIKFWSQKTLSTLLGEAGLKISHFHRLGRLPVLAKSMIAVARRP